MLLQLVHPWVGTLRKFSTHSDYRLMVSSRAIADMARMSYGAMGRSGHMNWAFVSQETSIIYLGDDAEPISSSRRDLTQRRSMHQRVRVRRVLVNGTVAIIRGNDFQHLQPHPNFVKSGLAD